MCQEKYNRLEMTQSNADTSAELWLNAAYDLLISSGIDAVKVMTLAKHTDLTRTGFYWHFKDLNAVHECLIDRWEETNTGNLIARSNAPAQTIAEAMLNVFDCWYDATLFDAPLDLAIRNWARTDTKVKARLDAADSIRINSLAKMFIRFGYEPADAEVRSLTVIYTQIGYISMHVTETPQTRLSRAANYVALFTGVHPTDRDITVFQQRNRLEFLPNDHLHE